MKTRIHKNLKHLRESQNRTKSWVAEQLGKKDATIGDYERGRATPPLKVLEQYADLFDIYVGDLVGKDLWLGEGSGMEVNEPSAPYGKHHRRVEELLHGKLDHLEDERTTIATELAALKQELEGVPKDSPAYGRIQRMIDLLKS